MRKFLALSLMLAFALTLGACDDGPTGPDISQKQAEEVADAVTHGVFQGLGIALGEAGGTASRAPSVFTPRSYEMPNTLADGSYTFDNSTSCPQGGSLHVIGDGTINTSQTQNTTTIDWNWNAQASYSTCRVDIRDGNDAKVIGLTTSSPIQFTGSGSVTSGGSQLTGGSSVSTVGTSGTFTWNYSGTVDWNEQGGPSASCDIDLTATLNVTGNQNILEFSGSVQGTTCGHDVDQTFSSSFSA